MSSNPVYGQSGSNDTPVLVPGWTVQNSATGTDQSLVNSGAQTGGLVQPQTAVAANTDAPSGTVEVSDFTSLQTTVNDIITALTAAGVFKS